MTTSTKNTVLDTVAMFLRDAGEAARCLYTHFSDVAGSVAAARKATALSQLSEAELDELGVTRDTLIRRAMDLPT